MFRTKHTTKIEPIQTAGEIIGILGHLGASDMQMEYKDREPAGMMFAIDMNGTKVFYKLPVRWKPLYMAELSEAKPGANRRKKGWEGRLMAQCKRTAWRIALDWLKVQLSFVETGMRSIEEVFLSDMVTKDGSTVGERLRGGALQLLLDGPKKP